jgi:hypothetical protein
MALDRFEFETLGLKQESKYFKREMNGRKKPAHRTAAHVLFKNKWFRENNEIFLI